jgi:adenylosuccinate synthase
MFFLTGSKAEKPLVKQAAAWQSTFSALIESDNLPAKMLQIFCSIEDLTKVFINISGRDFKKSIPCNRNKGLQIYYVQK